MNADEFEAIMEDTFNKCVALLGIKKREYATDTDRLANFKEVATIIGGTPEQALLGMWIKHVQSVSLFIRQQAQGKDRALVQWDEKIFDVINYMVLLRALLFERIPSPLVVDPSKLSMEEVAQVLQAQPGSFVKVKPEGI